MTGNIPKLDEFESDIEWSTILDLAIRKPDIFVRFLNDPLA
jgi:hypothetical protein